MSAARENGTRNMADARINEVAIQLSITPLIENWRSIAGKDTVEADVMKGTRNDANDDTTRTRMRERLSK
jgi:hypothetical protein